MILNLYAVAVSVREGSAVKSFPMYATAESRDEAMQLCYQSLLSSGENIYDLKMSTSLIPQHVVKQVAGQDGE